MLNKSYKQSTTESNNGKKSKRSNRPDIAFKNLTTSQKSLFKQNSLPCVSYIHFLTNIFETVVEVIISNTNTNNK